MASKSIGKNSIYSLIKSVSTVIFPLISFPYISRVLQPENVGKYNFSSSIVSYFSMFASLGITTYAVRECAKRQTNREQLEKTASQIFSINVFTTFIAYLALALTVLFVPRLHNYAVLIFVQSISILFTTLGAEWINTAMEDFRYITIRTFLFQLISLFLMFAFVKHQSDYLKYAVVVVISTSGANLVNIFYRKRYCSVYVTINLHLKEHLKPIVALFAMIVAQQIFIASDTTMIGFFYGDYEVGLYSTSIKVYNVINQLVASITWVVLPQLSKCFSEDKRAEGANVLEYAYQFLLTLGLPCVIGIYFFSEQVVTLVGGAAYIEASGVMRILAITLGMAIVACYCLNINILASGNDKVGLAACSVSAIFNLIMNYIFIPLGGIKAAAWTTVCSQIIVILICVPFIPRGFGNIKIIKKNWPPIIAGIVLNLFCFVLKKYIAGFWTQLVIGAIGGCILYFLILIVTKYSFMMKILDKF